MKTILLLLAMTGICFAEDWTIGAKTYQNVMVGDVEADCVHITYANGIGCIMIADMPPDLRARFKYDPTAARIATTTKIKTQADAEAAMMRSAPKSVGVAVTAPANTISPSPVDVASINAQIADLKTDLETKKKIQSQETRDGHVGNGYKDAILDDENRINALESMLPKSQAVMKN